jgi:hypothetical protein
MMSLLV